MDKYAVFTRAGCNTCTEWINDAGGFNVPIKVTYTPGQRRPFVRWDRQICGDVVWAVYDPLIHGPIPIQEAYDMD